MLEIDQYAFRQAISKRAPTYGANTDVGHRNEAIAKAMKMPISLAPISAKKAPVLARTGPKVLKKTLITPNARLSKRFLELSDSRGATSPPPRERTRSLDSVSSVAKAAGDVGEAFSTLRHLGATAETKANRGLRPRKINTGSPVDALHTIRELGATDETKANRGLSAAKVAAPRRRRAAPLGLSALAKADVEPATASKAYRSFSAEDRRQRRLGAMSAGSGLGGAALVGHSAKRTRDANKPLKIVRDMSAGLKKDKGNSKYKSAVHATADMLKGKTLVPHSAAAEAAGGVALLGAGRSLLKDKHKRRWN